MANSGNTQTKSEIIASEAPKNELSVTDLEKSENTELGPEGIKVAKETDVARKELANYDVGKTTKKSNKDEAMECDGGGDVKKLYPAVAMYGPYTITGLKKGEIKKWCTCGLSKKQPWCDGAHKGTGFKSLKWTVPHDQSKYQICACKYSKTKPICDATHTNLPCEVIERQKNCEHKAVACDKLCTDCGWVPDF